MPSSTATRSAAGTLEVLPAEGKGKAGRRLLIEVFPDVRRRIVAMVYGGAPLALACVSGKISERTLYNYLAEGEAILDRHDAAAEAGSEIELTENERILLQFVQEIREAQSAAILKGIKNVTDAGARDWKASAFWLERTHRVHFARPEPIATISASKDQAVIKLSWSDGTPDDEPL